MYLISKKGTKGFDILTELQNKMKAAREAQAQILNELNATKCILPVDSLAGGIDGIQFEVKPNGWKHVHKRLFSNCYYPMALPANKELIDRLKALPKITDDDVAKHVKFEPQIVGKIFCIRPAIYWGNGFVLMEITKGMKYKKLPGMQEITESEWNRYKNKIDTEKNTKRVN